MRHALGLIALLPVLQACASSHQEGLAARPAEPPRENLETRLQTLADKYAIEERSPRDPAVIRAQISRLEARRLTLLGQYTPTHPGVLQIERQLRLLREQLAEAESAPKVTTPPAP
jgi:hypothetical protein